MKLTIVLLLGFLCVNANGSNLKGILPPVKSEILHRCSELFGEFYTLCEEDCVEQEVILEMKESTKELLKYAENNLSEGSFLTEVNEGLTDLIAKPDYILSAADQPREKSTLELDEQSEIYFQNEKKGSREISACFSEISLSRTFCYERHRRFLRRNNHHQDGHMPTLLKVLILLLIPSSLP